MYQRRRDACLDVLKRVSRNYNDDLDRLQAIHLSFYALRNDGEYAAASLWSYRTRDGKPRMLKQCKLPVTAPGAVTLVSTDLGLFEITPQGFKLLETAPGWSPEDIQELTEAKLVISDELREFRLR